jgi:2-amino-4-hydroxy-6-hydroxymethyldihydropteridine diphosphokinase
LRPPDTENLLAREKDALFQVSQGYTGYDEDGLQLVVHGKSLVGLGANCPGPWGTPADTITRALREIDEAGPTIEAISPFYETVAVGRVGQPPYVNAAALIDTVLSGEALLRLLKAIERRAGRRGGSPWGSRTLDIDILDHKGLVSHWRGRHPRFARPGPRPLILPHPWIAERPFVLRPLLDIAPEWRHPVLKTNVRTLWQRAARRREGQVVRRL